MGCATELLRQGLAGTPVSLITELTVRIEIEHQAFAFQGLKSAYEAVERLYPTDNNVASHQCYLIQRAQALRLRDDELTKRKAELEGEAEMAATLSCQTDVSILLVDHSHRNDPTRYSHLLLARGLLAARVSTSRSCDYCSAVVGVPPHRVDHRTLSLYPILSSVLVCALIVHIPFADSVPRHELPLFMH
jgi:hypothetical protein